MDDQRLNLLLGRLKEKTLPQSPANLGQNVWREIRLRQETPFATATRYWDVLAWFRGGATNVIASALVLTLVMSVGMTLVTGQSTSTQHVQRALGLRVFSHQSSPLTRLAENP